MEFFDIGDKWFWLKVVQLVITAISVLISVIMAIKKRKVKFSELLNNMFSWIEEAETHTTWEGNEKLDFVLNRAFKYCMTYHIKYEEEDITNEVERILALSKSVNNAYHAPEETKSINPVFTGEK